MIQSCGTIAVTLLADDSLYSWDDSLCVINPERVIADPVAAFETWFIQEGRGHARFPGCTTNGVPNTIWVLTCGLKLMIGSPTLGGLHDASEVAGILNITAIRAWQALNDSFSAPILDLGNILNERVSNLHEYLDRLKEQAGRLTLDEGCVYDLDPKSEPGVSPTKLIIGSNEYTNNIIARKNQIFFTTDSGLCYHLDMDKQLDDENKKPVLLRYLADYFVENVFILATSIVIQHDGGKLSLLLSKHKSAMRRLAQVLEGLPPDPSYQGFIDLTYEQGGRPIALSFFDDKDIVSVSQTYARIYFTTSTGQVYYCNSSGSMTDPKIELIPFFNDNPVAVKVSAASIRSAGNTVKTHT